MSMNLLSRSDLEESFGLMVAVNGVTTTDASVCWLCHLISFNSSSCMELHVISLGNKFQFY